MTDALASALMEGSYSDGVRMLMRLIDSLGVARHVRLETTGFIELQGPVELLIEAVRQKNCVRRVQPTFRKRLEQDNEAPLIVLATSGPLTPQWVFYFSIAKCDQTFMRCQWDSLLLETLAAAVCTSRFLFFKFMPMSGAVKIQSRCPTWLGLSALDFHFASQPLPLPLGWHALQAPPIMNRLAVAVTLLIALQIFILFTGNYNFFNFLFIWNCASSKLP
ncbi:hypothetical protein F442_15369, partial [Phytophthora nicotianae P10297]